MALLPLLFVVTAAFTLGVGATLVRRSPPSTEATVAAARRHARWTSGAAIGLGVAAAVVVADTGAFAGDRPGGQGITVLLVPVAFAVVHTLVLLLGELTWPRPVGEVRHARLARRGTFDTAPRWLLRSAAGAAVGFLAVVTVGALAADPDGRSFSYLRGTGMGAGDLGQTASPFPGWFYGRPAVLGLVVAGVVTLVALHVVATRPAVVTRDERIEAALRRASAHRVLRGATAALLVDTGGLLFIAGTAMPDIGPAAFDWLEGGAMAIGVLSMLAGAAVAFSPAPRVPAEAPAVPVG
ncbi:hypothetical protein [Blastococcus montanus]|uniref:hypothetical protein n=1 Tax=Blastococcus montanus TaxID=3144973 RepID=UPI00320A6DF4